MSASPVDRKLAGLAFWFKLQGVGEFTKSFMFRQAMKGYCRGRRTRDMRRLVSISILRAVLKRLQSVCSSEYEWSLFQAAFFRALLIGELVSPSKRTARVYYGKMWYLKMLRRVLEYSIQKQIREVRGFRWNCSGALFKVFAQFLR